MAKHGRSCNKERLQQKPRRSTGAAGTAVATAAATAAAAAAMAEHGRDAARLPGRTCWVFLTCLVSGQVNDAGRGDLELELRVAVEGV